MAKRGQHHNSGTSSSKPRGHEKSSGHNNPSKSQTITTGTYKKKETYQEQARKHEDPYKVGQVQRNDWDDEREAPSNQGSPRARESDITGGRSGSRSNRS